MKILHTSDWHLGHRLHEQSQYDEQFLFLKWLQELITKETVDVLIIAGDIFDTGMPSAQSQKLYYDFLVALHKTACRHIIVIGGNHDAPGMLNAPKALLASLNIRVVGKATENIEDEIFELQVNSEKLVVAAVPYLRDQDIRRALAGESFDELSERYKTALRNHYHNVAEHCTQYELDKTFTIATGHLFALGGSTTDSEQSIYVGNLGDIGIADFPQEFDYLALGHLHKAQKVGGSDSIRYSGSPYALSFSELGHEKKVLLLETHKKEISSIKELNVPKFRTLYKVVGKLSDCIKSLEDIDSKNHDLQPWAEVVLDDENQNSIAYSTIKKTAENLTLELLKVSFKHEDRLKGLEQLIERSVDIRDLSPMDVFTQKCKEQKFDLDTNSEIFDAFHEIVSLASEQQ